MSSNQIEQLQADADDYHHRAALLRAKLYSLGLGTNAQLQELERELGIAQQRLREERLNTVTRYVVDPAGDRSCAGGHGHGCQSDRSGGSGGGDAFWWRAFVRWSARWGRARCQNQSPDRCATPGIDRTLALACMRAVGRDWVVDWMTVVRSERSALVPA